jgi:hypothetical protein
VCSFPLFQDTEEVNAWGLQGGGKDDIYVYDPKGILRNYYDSGVNGLTLSDPIDYAALKQAVLEAEAP